MAWTCQALSHIALRARLSLLYLLREPIDRQLQLCYRLPTAWSREEKQTRRYDRTGCQIHQQPLVATTSMQQCKARDLCTHAYRTLHVRRHAETTSGHHQHAFHQAHRLRKPTLSSQLNIHFPILSLMTWL